MSRILLITPKFDSEFSRARTARKLNTQREMFGSLMTPLNMATIAALTPDDFEVAIWDEGARGDITDETDLGGEFDLVGVTGYIAHLPRAIQIAQIIRKRGIPVVIGGPGVSGSPDLCRDHFDVIFLGEAELTWPRFLREWQRGQHRSEYRQVERPDLALTPVPRWDLIADDISHYRLAGVQTTRGCPFDCEFCDVIHLFGRKPRHKPIDRVLTEITELEKRGARRIFICDDDFTGDPRYARDLLTELKPLNNSFQTPLNYSTQLTIDVSEREDILALMADCNFSQVLIGIETPRKASLTEANKVQNMHGDLVENVRKVQSYGIGVKAALMMGFDADDKDIFDEQWRFIEDSYVTGTNMNSIKAYPGTPLWVRLQLQDRILDVSEIYDEAPKVVSNVLPKQMTLPELLEGYGELLGKVRSWDSFKRRIKKFVDGVTRQPDVKPTDPTVRDQRMAAARGFISTLPEEVRNHVVEIMTYTMQRKPWLIERVSNSMMQHFMDWTMLQYHQTVIRKEIELYNAGRFPLDKDNSAGMIPPDFGNKMRDQMGWIYDRLSEEMLYKPGISEAFVSIFKDFLIRWGKTFKGFEDFHKVYLNELVDRHTERWNARYAEGNVDSDENTLELTRAEATSQKFIRPLLVAVEQEMRGEIRSGKVHEPVLVPLGMPGGNGGRRAVAGN